jgi:hypothetical protein
MWQEGNKIMGPQPFMRRLRQLHCSSCNLSGPLPTQWQNMDNLQVVSLARNNLTSLSWFGAGRLTRLVLDGNPLGTRLEPMLAAGWRLLKFLSLSRCQLTGSLPAGECRACLYRVAACASKTLSVATTSKL